MTNKVEQIRKACPELETSSTTVRSYSASTHTIFVGKQQSGEEAPLTMEQIQELGRDLKALGLDNKDLLAAEYKRALDQTQDRIGAWTIAARHLALKYLESIKEAENVAKQRRLMIAINTLSSAMGPDIVHNLKFVAFKGETEFAGETAIVAGICPFMTQALEILRTGFEVMEMPIRLPSPQAASSLPFFLLSKRLLPNP